MPDLTTAPAPFRIYAPERQTLPFVFASPHSGQYLPPAFLAMTDLDAHHLRRSGDAFVDTLFSCAPLHGAPLLAATHSRAYIDLNRAPDELDPAMIRDLPPGMTVAYTDRVASGLGLLPKYLDRGKRIYRHPVAFAEIESRLHAVHAPYHAALAGLMEDTRRTFGAATLIDCHSMPCASGTEYEIVLGDRFGTSCNPALTCLVETLFSSTGYEVRRNIPYAGGFCTRAYGLSGTGFQALQIEIRRDLYMDEETLSLHAGADRLTACIGTLFDALKNRAAAGARARAAE